MTEFSNRWIPAMVSSQFVLFPGTAMPVTVTDERNLAALREMKARGLKNIHVITRKDAEKPITMETLYPTSCLAEVEYIKGNETEEVQLIVRGIERHYLDEISWDNDSCLVHTHQLVVDVDIDPGTVQTYMTSIKELADKKR